MTFVIPEKQEATQLCLPHTLKTDNGSNNPPLRASQKSPGAKHITRDSRSSVLHRRHPGSTLASSVMITNTGLGTAEGELIKQRHSDTVNTWWGTQRRGRSFAYYVHGHNLQPHASERGEQASSVPSLNTQAKQPRKHNGKAT